MGICKSKVEYYKQVALPTTAKDKKIQQIYGPMVDVDHKDNVNKKYAYLIDLKKDIHSGDGIMKTNQYISKVTKADMEKQINEFWGRITRD